MDKIWFKISRRNKFSCSIEVFGKYKDNRYETKGNISYSRTYEDNLNSRCKTIILNLLSWRDKVYLYQK